MEGGPDESDFASKYPFSSAAKKMLEGGGAELDDRLVQMGLERIRKSMKGEPGRSIALNEAQRLEEIATYAAARMILGTLRNGYLSNRFAVGESKRVHAYLNGEADEVVRRVGEEVGVEASGEGKTLLVDLPVFLKFAPKSVHYRLVNREISGGKVAISSDERKRLIEEAVRKRLERMPVVKDPPKSVRDAAKALLDELPKPRLPSVNARPGDHPPCVDKLLESAGKHQNLPHTARWFLATYLIALGLNDEQISGIYSSLPDYSPKITKYQLEHARKKGYSVPSCATVGTYGLCVANCRVGTPLGWHERGGGTRIKEGGSQPQDGGGIKQETAGGPVKQANGRKVDGA